MAKAKYRVKKGAGTIKHDKAFYRPGDTIELEEVDAARIKHLLEGQEAPQAPEGAEKPKGKK
jgi:hypothetical protein